MLVVFEELTERVIEEKRIEFKNLQEFLALDGTSLDEVTNSTTADSENNFISKEMNGQEYSSQYSDTLEVQ